MLKQGLAVHEEVLRMQVVRAQLVVYGEAVGVDVTPVVQSAI